MPFVVLAVTVAAALGGSAAVVADRSLPGDPLWSFKVHVNESLQTSLAGSVEATANRHIEAIDARLTEAEHLAAQGRLSAQAQASIKTNFDTHTKAVASAIAELETAGKVDAAADVAARYQATIAARTAALAEAQINASEEVSASLSPILVEVRATLDHASELSAEASAKAAVESSSATAVKAGVDGDTGINLGI